VEITIGLFSTGIVTSNTPAILTAQYASGGFLYTASGSVLVLDLPSPRLISAGITADKINFQVEGVSNRLHVIEAADSLSAPILWQPIGTNALDTFGLWNFSEPLNEGHGQR